MKRIIYLIIPFLLLGCGKSQIEIEKEKQEVAKQQRLKEEQALLAKKEAELKITKEKVKYQLKDGESARFRNVVKNCGEVNAKNSWGAYSGFTRFIVKDDGQVLYETQDNAYLFDAMIESYCSKEYLMKFLPKRENLTSAANAAEQDAANAALVDGSLKN